MTNAFSFVVPFHLKERLLTVEFTLKLMFHLRSYLEVIYSKISLIMHSLSSFSMTDLRQKTYYVLNN